MAITGFLIEEHKSLEIAKQHRLGFNESPILIASDVQNRSTFMSIFVGSCEHYGRGIRKMVAVIIGFFGGHVCATVCVCVCVCVLGSK